MIPGRTGACPFCLAAIAREAAVCGACANPLRGACRACGRAFTGLTFCQGCGEALGELGTRHDGAYRLIRLLGQGAMARTFLALDAAGHTVALKELKDAVAGNAKATDLFLREAITLRQLAHPDIPRLLAFFTEGDRKVQVVEHVGGQSLDRVMARDGCLSERQVTAWLGGLCEVLDYLHGQQVIHRDIKPSNLVLRAGGSRLALIDFGAVKEAGAEPGTVIATAGYAPFEQMQGEPVPQSDLFAVGATALALVTGQEPATRYDAARAEFDTRGLSPALAAIVRRATAYLPGARYASARELRQALAAV